MSSPASQPLNHKPPEYPTGALEALRAHLRDGLPLPIDADDALATMELIDACYRAAGFHPAHGHRECSRLRAWPQSRPSPLHPANQANR